MVVLSASFPGNLSQNGIDISISFCFISYKTTLLRDMQEKDEKNPFFLDGWALMAYNIYGL